MTDTNKYAMYDIVYCNPIERDVWLRGKVVAIRESLATSGSTYYRYLIALEQGGRVWRAEAALRSELPAPTYEPTDNEFITTALVAFYRDKGDERALKLASLFGQQTIKVATYKNGDYSVV